MVRASGFPGLLWFALMCAPSALWAQPSSEANPMYWLERMGQIGQTYTYDGVLVYRRGEKMRTLRLVQQEDPDGQPIEQLQSLDGAPQEVTLTDRQISCQLANYHIVLSRAGRRSVLWPIAARDWQRVERHYQLGLGEDMRVAGREAHVIHVTPKDGARYGQTLWLDKQTAFPLRADLRDAHGIILTQWTFTSLTLKELTGKMGSVSPAPAPTEAVKPYRLTLRQPEPLGFVVVMRSDDANANDAVSWVEHWMLSDGLATVSAYLEQTHSGETGYLEGLSERAPIHAYGRKLGGYHLTVVGEVPGSTAQNLAEQFELVSHE